MQEETEVFWKATTVHNFSFKIFTPIYVDWSFLVVLNSW